MLLLLIRTIVLLWNLASLLLFKIKIISVVNQNIDIWYSGCQICESPRGHDPQVEKSCSMRSRSITSHQQHWVEVKIQVNWIKLEYCYSSENYAACSINIKANFIMLNYIVICDLIFNFSWLIQYNFSIVSNRIVLHRMSFL